LTTKFKRTMAIWLSFLMLLALFPYKAAAENTPGSSITPGEYTVAYRYVEDGKSNTSVANGFMNVANSGKLFVDETGNMTFQHEITSANYIHFEYLGYRQNDKPKAIITKITGQKDSVVGLDGYTNFTVTQSANGNVIVSMPINQLDTNPDILMHIDYKGNLVYDHWYNAQLEINKSGLPGYDDSGEGTDPESPSILDKLNELVTNAEALYANTNEGVLKDQAIIYEASEYGKYPTVNRVSLLTAIESAREGILQNSSNEQLLLGVYQALEAELVAYKESVIALADRKALYNSLKIVKPFVDAVVTVGTTEGKPDISYPPATAGEHVKEARTTLTTRIKTAETAIANYSAAQSVVDSANRRLMDDYTRLKEEYYLETEPVKVHFLDATPGQDGLEPANKLSPFAGDFLPTVTYLKVSSQVQKNSYANLTFTVSPEPQEVVRSIPDSDGGLQDINLLEYATELYRAVHMTKSSTANKQVYQVMTYTALTNLNAWEGLSYVRYKVGEETRNVFISYNADILEQLKLDAAAAKKLIQDAVAAPKKQEEYEHALEELELALTSATELVKNLAAKRPAILSSTKELTETVAAFSAVSITVSELNALLGHAQAAYDTAVEGSAAGRFKSGSKQKLADAIATANEAIENAETQADINNALESLTQAFVRFEASKVLAVGNYTVDFRTADNSDLTDFVNLEGELTVSNGKHTVSFTPKEGAAITKLINTETDEAILPIGAAAQALTTIAAVQTSSETSVKFELADLSAAYKLVLLKNGAQEQSEYLFQFASITQKVDPTPGNPGTGGLADGNYTINYRVLKDGTDSISIMDGYVVKPALLKVQGGSKTIMFTVTQSKEVHTITLNGSSQTNISHNTSNNSRVVSFPLTSLSGKQNGTVDVDWPEIDYIDKHYVIQFVFDESSIQATTIGTPPDGTPPPPPTFEDGTDPDSDDESNSDNDEGSTTQPQTSVFKDVAKHWAASSIEKATKLGIAKGYQDGTFRPNGNVTRAEFATFISRALKLPTGSSQREFSDTVNTQAWAKPYIAQVVEAGLVFGYSDQTFKPERAITRAELAVIIARAAGLNTTTTGQKLTFKDSNDVPSWAVNAISAAVEAGLIQGKTGNQFDPNGQATRAEALTMIMRLLDYKAKVAQNATTQEAA
jgi:heme-binding NEAT domain protein